MGHESGHVIISIATPIEVAKVKTRGGIAAAALVLLGVLLGVIFF